MLETIGDHYAVFLKGHGIVISEQTIERNAVSYQHGIKSRKEVKRLTRSMMKNIWPDEVR